MSQAPQNWIDEIQSILVKTHSFPLSVTPPQFPWDAFAREIANLFQVEDFKITPRKTERLPVQQLTSGFGANTLVVTLEATPVHGQFFWIMGKEDVAKLTGLALLPSNSNKGFSSSKFQEGFYYFLLSQALLALDQLQALGDLSVKMHSTSLLPDEEAVCTDIELHHPKHTFWGRLICPASFLDAYKAHFSSLPPPPLTNELAGQIDVSLRLQIGQTELPPSKWEAVSVGDLVLLDRCTYDPHTQKGGVLLVLEGTPLLRARLKDNSLKIVDYATYREEQPPTDDAEESFDGEDSLSEPEESTDAWPSEEEKPKQEEFIVEAGRVEINLEKLLQLTPGEMLELPVHPESGVDIIAGGKKVAKGELIKLGELIGVRILQKES
ncbi:MAG: type III secretion system cytoplasmic ring protein SctQ [Candidatus Melainabacteria bacterium]|nr:type III secretion system cytoplasmic ring protein SctQ [Candidatus Melainabacteria bacterium]